jgi:hypothetical protein
MNKTLSELSVKDLKRAIKIKAKLEILQARLEDVLGASDGRMPSPSGTKGRRRMSAAGRAAIAAAARRRWAKVKGKKKGRRTANSAMKARLSAIAKARWKKAKAEGRSRL